MAAKEETAYYQWEIMRMLNIEDEEIKKYINSHGLHHLIFYYIICVCKKTLTLNFMFVSALMNNNKEQQLL